jgi:thiol-disulfide isomerase/thioredoxin
MKTHIAALAISLFIAVATPPAHAGFVDFLNGVKVGQQLPEHDLQFLGDAPTLSGQVLYIDFWATHCAPCVAALPEINKLHDKFAAKGLVVIAVSDETDVKIKSFMAKHPMRHVSAVEGKKSLTKALKIKAIPYSIFVDRKGKIIWRGSSEDITDELVEGFLKVPADTVKKP